MYLSIHRGGLIVKYALEYSGRPAAASVLSVVVVVRRS
jgi:hypothetical protein